MNEKLIVELMTRAYDVARRRSNDPSSQNGAMIYKPGKAGSIRAIPGWNHIKKEHPKDWSRPNKYSLVEHAERHSICQTADTGEGCRGATIVCPWAACCDCARAIIHSGIKTLIVHQNRMDLTPFRWRENVRFAMSLLKKSGVEVISWSGKLNLEPILVDGKEWTP